MSKNLVRNRLETACGGEVCVFYPTGCAGARRRYNELQLAEMMPAIYEQMELEGEMSSEERFGLSKIGQVAVTVRDLERAVAFYRDRLGMAFLFQAPNMAFFDCGGVRLLLGLPEPEAEGGSSIIYYKVEEIAAAFEALHGRGVEFVEKPHRVARLPDHDLWMAFLKDSEGNTLALMSEVRTGATA